MSGNSRAVILEPDPARARALVAELARRGWPAEVVSELREGQGQVSGIGQASGSGAAAWEQEPLPVVLVPPVPVAAAQALLGGVANVPIVPMRVGAVIELIGQSLLGERVPVAIDTVLSRVAESFAARQCVYWERVDAAAAPASAHLHRAGRVSLAAGVTAITAASVGDELITDAPAVSLLAAMPYRGGSGEGERGGALCMAAAGLRRYARGELITLAAMAQRLTHEMAWLAAHQGAASAAAAHAGATLGGMYRMREEISSGAMGTVYRGEDVGLGRPVAIKVLRPSLAIDRRLVDQFRREAATLAQVHHPHLVQVYSIGSEGADVYFVMELVEGVSIAEVIAHLRQEDMAIDTEVVSTVVEEIADALDTIHAAGIIHRDVKPANIVLDRINDRAVLVDLGIAKRGGDHRDAAGTPGYAAPESFLEESETPATDVYGLAATAYAMLTGDPPFRGGTVGDVVQQQLKVRPGPASQLRPELALAVDEVLFRALAPDPGLRYGSAAAFALALRRALQRSTGEETMRWRGRRRPPVDTATLNMGGDWGLHDRAQLKKGPDTSGPLARGIIFGAAHRYLAGELASEGVERLRASDTRVRRVLTPTILPLGWEPLDSLEVLLDAIGREGDERGAELAHGLGRAIVSSSFAGFLGGDGDPTAEGPKSLLRATTGCWERYFKWGSLVVEDGGDRDVKVIVNGAVASPLMVDLVAGFLARVAELGGAHGVQVDSESSRAAAGSGAVFRVGWQAQPAPLK